VYAGYCVFPQSRDLRTETAGLRACLMFRMRTHTGPRFIVSSEGRESHQPQVIRASHTNSKILVIFSAYVRMCQLGFFEHVRAAPGKY
jgi:hypothetical protein